jgi:prefoldin subunit 5
MSDEIRAEVEREQALADMLRKIASLEEELRVCRDVIKTLEQDKEGAGMLANVVAPSCAADVYSWVC